MKLIDLLLQELPKRGGWPDGCLLVIKNKEEDYLRFRFKDRDLNCAPGISFYGYGVVKKEEYESALAASKQVEWDGVGLPPVGCECEAMMSAVDGKKWQWRKVKVALSGIPSAEKECLVYDIETTRPAWVDEFRPIRTEAERNREEAIKALQLDEVRTGVFITEAEATAIYDAIAAGEIPGVKLED